MPFSDPETDAEKTRRTFRARNFLESMGFAWQGLRQIVREEANFRTQLVLACLVVLMGVFFHVTVLEWLFLVFCIILMLVLEIMNTVIERLCDLHAQGEYHADVKFIKDIAAAACLITATGSTVIGALIFFPYFLKLLSPLAGNIK
jgi:undecaprenol kinase